MTVKAFTYLRVSGKSQVDGDGFPRQREAVAKYATKNNIEIVREFTDEGVSGTKDAIDRPGLTALIEAVMANGVRLVIVEKADRLARDLIVSELIMRQMNKLGVTVVDAVGTDLSVDDKDPTKKLIRQVLSAVAEFEKTALVLKLKAARDRQKRAGGTSDGRKPYGFRPGEAEVKARMVELREGGMSYDAIAAQLNADAVPTRTGTTWHGKVVRGILMKIKP